MLRTKVREFSIGPASDPYSATSITARDGTKTAEFYYDGLGCYRMELTDGELLVRSESWHGLFRRDDATDAAKRVRGIELKARLLFKRFIGVDAQAIYDEWWDTPASPAPRIWM